MPKEVQRFISPDGTRVIIRFDDGSEQNIPTITQPPDRDFDSEDDVSQNSGHVFTQEELQ